MMLYPYALFVHIVGVIGLFISISLELTMLFRLRAAKTTIQVHEWMTVSYPLEKILPASALLILASGLYLTFAVWGWSHAWIDLSLSLLIILGILGPVINGPRIKAIQMAVAVAPDGDIPTSLKKLIDNSILRVYAPIPGFIALGIVALMILKLDWIGSVVIIVVALVVSLIAGQLSRKTPRKMRFVAGETRLQS